MFYFIDDNSIFNVCFLMNMTIQLLVNIFLEFIQLQNLNPRPSKGLVATGPVVVALLVVLVLV